MAAISNTAQRIADRHNQMRHSGGVLAFDALGRGGDWYADGGAAGLGDHLPDQTAAGRRSRRSGLARGAVALVRHPASLAARERS